MQRSNTHIRYIDGNPHGDYIFPDVHGGHGPFQLLFEARLQEQKRIISVGDLGDRGLESLTTVKEFMQYAEENPDQVLMTIGNHEQVLVDYSDAVQEQKRLEAKGDEKAIESFKNTLQHATQGSKLLHQQWATSLEESKRLEIVDFYRSHPYIIYVKPTEKTFGYFVVHADLPYSSQEEFFQNESLMLTPEQIHYATWARRTPKSKSTPAFKPKKLFLDDDLMFTGHTVLGGLHEIHNKETDLHSFGLRMKDYRLCLDTGAHASGALLVANMHQLVAEVYFAQGYNDPHNNVEKTFILRDELNIFLNLYPNLRAIGKTIRHAREEKLNELETKENNQQIVKAKVEKIVELEKMALGLIQDDEKSSAVHLSETMHDQFFAALPVLTQECKDSPNPEFEKLVNNVVAGFTKEQIQLKNGCVCIAPLFMNCVYIIDDKQQAKKITWKDLAKQPELFNEIFSSIIKDKKLIADIHVLIKNYNTDIILNHLLMYAKTHGNHPAFKNLVNQLKALFEAIHAYERVLNDNPENPDAELIEAKISLIKDFLIYIQDLIIYKEENLPSLVLDRFFEIYTVFKQPFPHRSNTELSQIARSVCPNFFTSKMILDNGFNYYSSTTPTIGFFNENNTDQFNMIDWEQINDREEAKKYLLDLLCVINQKNWQSIKKKFADALMKKFDISMLDLLRIRIADQDPIKILVNFLQNHPVPADWKHIQIILKNDKEFKILTLDQLEDLLIRLDQDQPENLSKVFALYAHVVPNTVSEEVNQLLKNIVTLCLQTFDADNEDTQTLVKMVDQIDTISDLQLQKDIYKMLIATLPVDLPNLFEHLRFHLLKFYVKHELQPSTENLKSSWILKNILLNVFNIQIPDKLSQPVNLLFMHCDLYSADKTHEACTTLNAELKIVLQKNYDFKPSETKLAPPVAIKELIAYALQKRNELNKQIASDTQKLFDVCHQASLKKTVKKLETLLRKFYVYIPSGYKDNNVTNAAEWLVKSSSKLEEKSTPARPRSA